MELNPTVYIKNMVCLRCKLAVEALLKAYRIPYEEVQLGWARLKIQLTPQMRSRLDKGLRQVGLELMADRRAILIERIKVEIQKLLQSPRETKLKLSVYLSEELGHNYSYLAKTFSDTEGITLERYFITKRVERVKELIVYEDASLSEICDELIFSSVSHLCQQFKKVAGVTPAEFRKRSKTENFIWRELNLKNTAGNEKQ